MHHEILPTATKLGLAAAAAAAAFIGIAIAYSRWYAKKPQENESLEPAILKRAWGYDAAVSALVGGPGRAAAAFTAFTIDKRVIDGAVNGLATLVRQGGGQLRKVQTGYVRNYALGLAGGALALLLWTLVRVGL